MESFNMDNPCKAKPQFGGKAANKQLLSEKDYFTKKLPTFVSNIQGRKKFP
jgi:hypothetical protein